jgi:hypothetical protein
VAVIVEGGLAGSPQMKDESHADCNEIRDALMQRLSYFFIQMWKIFCL